MNLHSRSFVVIAFGLTIGLTGAGCAATSEAADQASSNLDTAGVHAPSNDERVAILSAFRGALNADLHGQNPAFNATDPAGRFLAHGDWAYFEGILEGPNGNTTPLDYKNSAYKDDFTAGALAGVQRNGNFAAKFQSLAHRQADGTWQVASFNAPQPDPTYGVGVSYDLWKSWASLPAPAQRDIFVSYPHDDLHAPQGADRDSMLAALTAQVSQDLHGQTVAFNTSGADAVFLAHDGWAFLSGLVVGPNDNAEPLDYTNSKYSQAQASNSFKGVLHHGNFAATVSALFKQASDGTWQVSPTAANAQTGSPASAGYEVGAIGWIGDAGEWSYDIFGKVGNGNGNGDGDGR
jgi:hypothetical protein